MLKREKCLANSNIIITFANVKQITKIMLHVETPNGYLVIERIGGMDVYMDECLVCELSGNLSSYTYDDEVDGEKLDAAIEEELETLNVLETITDPYNFI